MYRSREAWAVLAAMIGASIALNVVILPFTQVVDPVRASFGIDDVAFSVLVGAFYAVPSMAMSVAGGWLADRTSRRRLLLAAMLLWTGGAIWSALAPSYAQLAMARVVVAIGAGIKFPLAMTWINDAFPPERRGRAVGAFFVVLGLGPALGASIGGLVVQAAESGRLAGMPGLGGLAPWRAALLVLALPTLLFLPWVATLRDARSATAAAARTATPSARAGAASSFAVIVAMVVAVGLLSLADAANLAWLPTVLRRQHGFDARGAGFAFGLIATVAGALGPIVGGIAGDAAFRRHGTAGRLWLCAGSAALCVPLLAAYAVAPATPLIVALVFSGVLSVLALSLGYVAIQALLPDDRRGFGTGLVAAGSQLFAAAGPTVVAFVAARVDAGPRSLGIAVASVTVVAFSAAALTYAATARRLARLDHDDIASTPAIAETTSTSRASAS